MVFRFGLPSPNLSHGERLRSSSLRDIDFMDVYRSRAMTT